MSDELRPEDHPHKIKITDRSMLVRTPGFLVDRVDLTREVRDWLNAECTCGWMISIWYDEIIVRFASKTDAMLFKLRFA